MKQITLNTAPLNRPDASICVGRLVMFCLFYAFAMALVWQLAGPSPIGRLVAWLIALLAGRALWRAISEA
jgi:hypothetical protein